MNSGVKVNRDDLKTFSTFKTSRAADKATFLMWTIVESQWKLTEEVKSEAKSMDDQFKELRTMFSSDKYKEGAGVCMEVFGKSEDGRELSNVFLLMWVPDSCSVKNRMLYSSSEAELQSKTDVRKIKFTDLGEVTYENCLNEISNLLKSKWVSA